MEKLDAACMLIQTIGIKQILSDIDHTTEANN